MFGLNKDGFKRMRYQDILDSMILSARSTFGAEINTSERSPLGMFIRVIAFGLNVVWQLAEKVYYSGYKDTAEGYQLDGVGQYIGIKKKKPQKATGVVTFTGTAGTVIPFGFIVAYGNIQFWTVEQCVIGAGGTVDCKVEALEAGLIGNVGSNKVTIIFTALTGVTGVNNLYPIYGGTEVETDAEFRNRYDESIAKGGASTMEAIEAELLALDGVISAVVTENSTMATVGGIPPKSFESMLYGGVDAEIARAIFETKAAGMQAFGDFVIPVVDGRGISHNIGFSRVAEIQIYVKIDLTTDPLDFPTDGQAKIEKEVIKYIGGVDVDAVEYSGIGLGEDVVYTKIIGLCHSVGGVDDVIVTISTDNITFTAANVAITGEQVAITDFEKVTFL